MKQNPDYVPNSWSDTIFGLIGALIGLAFTLAVPVLIFCVCIKILFF